MPDPATGVAVAAEEASPRVFTAKQYRAALGAFATGVTVVTTRGSEHAYGMTANAFSSVSLDPPLVLICVITGSEGRAIIEQNGIFAINVLGVEQEPLSTFFASRDRPRGADAFGRVPHRTELTGSPILDGVAAHLDCRLASSLEVGDHMILIGEVLTMGVDPSVEPLIFHHGGYRLLKERP